MSIQKILAVSGKPGLYELKIQTRTGFVAESLLDGKKITVGMRANVSLLSEIAVYTYSEELRLAEVLKAIAGINILNDLRNDEDYKEANKSKDGFDFVAPLIILQGQSFLRSYLLPKIQKG